jgi:hypothetical protein
MQDTWVYSAASLSAGPSSHQVVNQLSVERSIVDPPELAPVASRTGDPRPLYVNSQLHHTEGQQARCGLCPHFI